MHIRLATGVFAALLLTPAGPLSAQDFGTFDPFVVDSHSVPGSVSVIADPTGSAPTKDVFSFAIPAGVCSDEPYEPGKPESDCGFNSTRAQYRENVFATKAYGNAQPKEAWYGWSVYFPEAFPFGKQQTNGGAEFFYWHNNQCPHVTFTNFAGQDETLNFVTNRSLGNYECAPALSLPIVEFSSLIGKWNRFEVFVKWAADESGEAQVYLDGRYLLHYRGPTLIAELKDLAYFKFGLYLCCTPGVETIKAQSALYSAVKRAENRNDLFIAEDRAGILALQTALNGLGCDTGKPDGVIGKRTREMALSCRKFEDGAMPAVLTAGSLATFVSLYSRTDAADLPKGSAPEAGDDMPAVTYPPEGGSADGLVQATYVVHANEARATKSGNDIEANSYFVGKAEKHPGISDFDFHILGMFNYKSGQFFKLQFFLSDDAPKAVADCPGSILKFPDGSPHVQVNFSKQDAGYVSTNAECLLEKLTGDQRAVVDLLTNNFADIAVGMAKDGSIDAVRHEGIRIFLTQIAKGEITLGR